MLRQVRTEHHRSKDEMFNLLSHHKHRPYGLLAY